MVDRLDRLRHQPVIRRDDQDNDVRHIGAALAHFGEGFVARRVEEGDEVTALGLDLIGADMLRDAAGFAAHHIGAAQRVEQAGLAVVDVAHDRDDRGTRLQRFLVINVGSRIDVDIRFRHALDVVAELGDEQFGGVLVDGLVDGDHHAHLEQRLDEVRSLLGHAVRQFLHRDCFRHHDIADLLFARLRLPGEVRTALLLTRTLERGEAAGAGALVLVERAGNGELAGLTAIASSLVTRGVRGLLGDRLGALRRDDRREAARRGRRCSGLGGSGRRFGLSRRCNSRRFDRSRSFGHRCFDRSGSSGCFGRRVCFGGFASLARFGSAARFLESAEALFLLAAVGGFERLKAGFFSLAQQPGLHFLTRLARGSGRRRGRRGRADRLRLGRDRRGDRDFGRGSSRFTRSARHQLAPLDLDDNLVGPPVAEGLLDLARLDRSFQAQRPAAERRLLVIAHETYLPFVSITSHAAEATSVKSCARSCSGPIKWSSRCSGTATRCAAAASISAR